MSIEAMKQALEALVMYGERHRATYLLGGAWDEEITLGDKAITAIKEALAQPEQIQPSADSNTHQPKRHELQAKGEHPAPCARHCEANAFQIVIKNLKAQLAQRKPLTDEELEAMAENHVTNCYFDTLKFARAIEAAHGIKENT